MTYARHELIDDHETLPQLPSWVTGAKPKTPEDVAFLSGAALAQLHLVLSLEHVPLDLLRARLALRAAEICIAHAGRPERAGELRDTLAFLQPGDSPGPAGKVYLKWRRAVERPVSVSALVRALPHVDAQSPGVWLDAGQGAPVTRGAAVLQAVLLDCPQDHSSALVLADAALAQALGWGHVVPLLARGLKRGDLRTTGDELTDACHRAVTKAVVETVREAAELARRTGRLRDVAPKLRARGAEAAVALFLSHDAVAPAALNTLRSDRAARRFCDRLVELGAVRELTGRDTFRLYGV